MWLIMMLRNNLARKRRVLLDGPYGYANLGDNAIAYCMSSFLTKAGIDVTISCLNPDYIEKSIGLPTLPILDFKTLSTSVLKAIGEFDAIIVGGGQQLQEHPVPNPFFGMFSRVCHMARVAKALNVPFIAWSVGMDWPLSPLARLMARHYLGSDNVTLILRDGKSYDHACSMLAGKSCRILHSKDAVFMLANFLSDDVTRSTELNFTRNKRLIVSPSIIKPQQGLRKMVELCEEAAQLGYEVKGWHSEIRPGYDLKVREMVDWGTIPGFEWLPPNPIDTNEVASLLSSASLLLTTRMHPAIIAVAQGVPAYGIATNLKMRSVFDELSMPYTNTEDLEALNFHDIVESQFEKSFSMAQQFSANAELGGEQVLKAAFVDA
ncbi:polysaccharide pyruvyl transferase family protein [Notoacmeibacter ruber]|uniref:Polysaccharide pyruvyl transferase family protein n=2 Tax=Notoacmeibacter ruber TaxID=2670375 RepID=A0A3L7JA96_9HYPH|nr:polysaccharide pyruvyl transferase family protein [Notoacmeibacter ruber]